MNPAAIPIPVLEDISFDLQDVRHDIRLEKVAKRVRAVLGGVVVADSGNVMLMLETGRLPVYYFPIDDVRMDLMTRGGRCEASPYKGESTYLDIRIGERRVENAAWRYEASPDGCPYLSRSVAFHWKFMDAWYEEDEEVYFHARDPHKRIDVLRSSRHVQVRLGGVVIADTHDPRLLFETGLPIRYYIPREDLRLDLLDQSDRITGCPYKGVTSQYWAASVDGVSRDVAWTYGQPLPEVGKIAGLVCFFNERVEIVVDGIPEIKQPSPWS